jgi:hypothetical protein
MNTAEPSAMQEVVRDQAPVAGRDNSSPFGCRYWWRLVKATALVLAGVGVQLWIDGPLPATPGGSTSTAPLAERVAVRGDSRNAPARSPSLLLAPEGPEALYRVPAESPRPVGTGGDIDQRSHSRSRGVEPLDGPKYHRIARVSAPARGSLRAGGGLPALPDAELPALPSARRFNGWTGEAVALSPVAVPATKATDARNPDADAASPAAPVPSASRVARAMPVAPPRDEESILLVLHEYETAVGRKDPAAAKAVWPALDDRALARAFNDLQSQSLALEDCGVTVANSNAAARAKCQGVATYLPKVGRRKPISASHEWTFNLSKTGGDWQIESAAIR